MNLRDIEPLIEFIALTGADRAAHRTLPAVVGDAPGTLLLHGRELARTKAALAAGDREVAAGYASLLEQADRALRTPLLSVAHKEEPPPGTGVRDYCSLARHYWPDPGSANGLPYRERRGEVNPEADSNRYDAARLQRLAHAVHCLALASYLSGEPKFGAHAALLLRTWFVDAATSQTPHCAHAGMIPGTDRAPGLARSEAYRYVRLVDAEALLERHPAWTDADRDAFQDWFRRFAGWLHAGGHTRARPEPGANRTRSGDTDQAPDVEALAASAVRAANLDAAYRLAARRGETLEAMLRRAEARGRNLERSLANAQKEARVLRAQAQRRTTDAPTPGALRPRRAAAPQPDRALPPPSPDLPGCLPYYVNELRGKVKAVGLQALRDRAAGARDLIARIASGGHMDYEGLLSYAAVAARYPDFTRHTGALAAFDPGALAQLATVVGDQDIDARDAHAAIGLFRLVVSCFGPERLGLSDKVLFVDLLTRAGAIGEARSWMNRMQLATQTPRNHACLLANTLHPDLTGEAGTEATKNWLEAINAFFTPRGLEPVRLAGGESPMLHRLECPLARDAAVSGPLVSVLMTTYEADASVATAVRSVLEQSWRNLELIIVDDASSESSYAALARLAESDRRIVLLRNETNQGTYVAKNFGLAVARGEFVTCHDSDDWSHPRKIEWQVAQLLDSAHVVGNLSFWVRMTDNLVARRYSTAGNMCYVNTSALMFRRQPVLERCGYWDSVRTSADTEYYKRIEAVFRQTLPQNEVWPPFAFGQVREGSLTGSASEGMSSWWISPRRRRYREAWQHWHQSAAGAADRSPHLFMPALPKSRPFPVPAILLPQRNAAASRPAYDVVVVADFRDGERDIASFADELQSMAADGHSMAICQVNSFHPGVVGYRPIDNRLRVMLHEETVHQVDLDEVVECRVLLVRDAPTLQFLSGPRSGIRAQRLLLVRDPEQEAGGENEVYDADACARNAEQMFGIPAQWVPADSFAAAIAADNKV